MAKNKLKTVKKKYIYPSEENSVMEPPSITLWLLLEFQCQCNNNNNNSNNNNKLTLCRYQ